MTDDELDFLASVKMAQKATRLTDEEVQTILKGVMAAGINAPGQSLAFRMKIDWLRARLAEVNP